MRVKIASRVVGSLTRNLVKKKKVADVQVFPYLYKLVFNLFHYANPFYATGLCLYHLKTPKSQWHEIPVKTQWFSVGIEREQWS